MCYHVESPYIPYKKTWPHSKINSAASNRLTSHQNIVLSYNCFYCCCLFFLISQSNAFNFDLNVLGQTGDFDC
jgi:hypothetical protein